jgi:RNA polymerase sigma-70 factor (ECF subfamily)
MRSFEELCRENYSRIYKYIFAMTGSREASEDLLQDVFTVAFEKGRTFLEHENPPAFLYRTARNLTLTYLRRQRQYPSEALDDTVAGNGGELLDLLMREQDRHIDETAYIQPVLGGLPSKQRTLYAQRYVDRRPISEIAADEGVSETALRMRLVRLRREILQIVRALRLDEF